MPTPTQFVPAPFVRPAYVPDQSSLLQLMHAASQARQQGLLQKGANTAQGRFQLAALLTEAFDSIQRNQDRKQALTLAQSKAAQDQTDKDRDFALRTAQFEDLAAQRVAAEEQRRAAQAQVAALRVGQGDPGPISEEGITAAQADPSVAQRTRYSFGPGTADGPELMPTDEQTRMAAAEKFVTEQGGVMGPNGPIMPPRPVAEPRETNPTEASLALLAAQGNPGAIRALEIIRAQRPPAEGSNRPVSVPDGGRLIDPATGRVVYEAPAKTVTPPKMAAGTADKVAMAQTSLAALDKLESLVNVKNKDGSVRFRDELMGPWAGRYNKAETNDSFGLASMLPDAPEGFADFAAESATLKNQVIQAITGAAVGVQEAGRIMDQIPTELDRGKVWQAKARSTRRNLQELMSNQIRMGTGAQGPLQDGTSVEVTIPSAAPAAPKNPFRK